MLCSDFLEEETVWFRMHFFLLMDVPEEWCLGVKPAKAVNSLALLKALIFGTSAKIVTAVFFTNSRNSLHSFNINRQMSF